MGNYLENPVNSNYKVILVDSISSELLIKKYYEDYGINVEKYFNGINQVDIYECTKTKYRFYYPFSLIGDSIFYKDLSVSKSNYYHSRWEHKLALDFAELNSNWLEIGSGNSFFLKKLLEKGVFPTGLELNQIEVENALKDNLMVLNQDFFSMEIPHNKYDVIALFQVLEHMNTISHFFEKAKKMVKIGGKIIFSVPNSNPYLYYFDRTHTLNLPPHHMGLWNKKSIKRVCEEFGFKLCSLKVEKLTNDELNYILRMGCMENFFFKRSLWRFLKQSIDLMPRFLKVRTLSMLRNRFFEGRNLFAVFEKV